MKRGAVAVLLFVLSGCTDQAELSLLQPQTAAISAGKVLVTSNSPTGPGSFADAVAQANADGQIREIDFAPNIGTIDLESTIVFSGPQPLSIRAHGATLNGASLASGCDAFVAQGGGDLAIDALIVRNAPGIGIVVDIPATATGTVRVALSEVTSSQNGEHGVLINDQSEYFNDPNSTAETGSAASLDVRVSGSHFTENGFAGLDQDGLRVNEGGDGNLLFDLKNSLVTGNGGDGVELDERAGGDVVFQVHGSTFEANGSFSSEDFDDGIDVDEGGDGSIHGAFLNSSAIRNFEQGIDLNQNGTGDIRVDLTQVQAIGNNEEGIEYEEDDDVAGGGDIVATLIQVIVRDNGTVDGDAGLKLREKGPGTLHARGVGLEATANFVDGILLREDAAGTLSAILRNVVATNNLGDGVDVDENSSGDLDVQLWSMRSLNNALAGVRADQATTGTGWLQLNNYQAQDNGSGPLIHNAGVTVIQR